MLQKGSINDLPPASMGGALDEEFAVQGCDDLLMK
jgi:hypothetical protein